MAAVVDVGAAHHNGFDVRRREQRRGIVDERHAEVLADPARVLGLGVVDADDMARSASSVSARA